MTNLPNRAIYCLQCEKKTLSTSVQLHDKNRPRGAPGKQYVLKGTCSVCRSGQAQFVSGETGGNLNNLLNSGKLLELHLPGHNYTCPGTKLKERLLRGDAPAEELDKAAQFQYMSYAIFRDTKDRHAFDKKQQDEAFNFVKDSNHS